MAPPVTPQPGEPFVGYWSGRTSLTLPEGPISIEVLRQNRGYEVSVDGRPAVPTPLVDGDLLVCRTGQSSPQLFNGAQVELLWRAGHCVLSFREGPYVTSPELFVLARQNRAAFVKGVDVFADYEAWFALFNLAQAIKGWVSMGPSDQPPAPSQLRPDSAFVRWVRSQAPAWFWPRNPFTGQPMVDSSSPGDFTYTVKGRSWKLIGHESGGGTFNALTERPGGISTEPSSGT